MHYSPTEANVTSALLPSSPLFPLWIWLAFQIGERAENVSSLLSLSPLVFGFFLRPMTEEAKSNDSNRLFRRKRRKRGGGLTELEEDEKNRWIIGFKIKVFRSGFIIRKRDWSVYTEEKRPQKNIASL